ncbi:MAG: methyltransferase domain-containing protein [Aquificae bacterium]|nr:methyltransferase domain-containing protein [Aquificota bacterium]
MGDTSRPSSRREIGRRFSLASDSYRRWALPQRAAARRLVELFGKFVGGSSVLEAGAGVGLLSELLEPLVGRLFVCDLVKEVLEKNPAARARRAFVCNMENLPLKDRSVDWTASSFALHWSDYRRSLAEFARVSKKGFFAAVPVEGSLEGLGFPFPSAGEILELVRPTLWRLEEVDVPFRGREFLLFFKKTGTGYNPTPALSAFEILKDPSKVRFYGFKVLYFLKEL